MYARLAAGALAVSAVDPSAAPYKRAAGALAVSLDGLSVIIYKPRRVGKAQLPARRTRGMRTPLAAVGLLALGVLLMANPLFLPVSVGEPNPAYTHTVQPVGDGSVAGIESPATGAENGSDGGNEPNASDAVVAYADLDPAARAAFDRARDAPEGGFGVESPDDRVDSLSYPTEPTLGDGLLIVERDGERYEFWTRTVEREPGAVVVQRVLVQPVGFLVGFLAVVAGAAVALRGRLGGE